MTEKAKGFQKKIKFVRLEGTDIYVISTIMDYRIKPLPDIKIFALAPLGEHIVWCRFSKTAQVRAQVNVYKEYVPPFGKWKTTKINLCKQ